KDMTLRGSIALGAGDQDGLLLSPGDGLVLRGQQVLIGLYYRDKDNLKRGSKSLLLTVDSTTDTIVNRTDDTRCADIYSTSLATDGTTYFGSFPLPAVVRTVFGAGFGAPTCELRVVPNGLGFDQGWTVDLTALAGGRPAGQFILVDDRTA